MGKPFVFHLKREYFDMIKSGLKTCEYRFKVPEGLFSGSCIRFDLAYKPLSDKSAHLYARCLSVQSVRLFDCPFYVFECYDILCCNENDLIYRIDFDLIRDDDSAVMSAPIVGSFGG